MPVAIPVTWLVNRTRDRVREVELARGMGYDEGYMIRVGLGLTLGLGLGMDPVVAIPVTAPPAPQEQQQPGYGEDRARAI